MNNASKIIIAVVAVIVIAFAASLLVANPSKESKDSSSPSSDDQSSQPAGEVRLVINYENNGFNPKTSAIKAGEAIKIVNQSQKDLDFASNDHPIHTDNSELNVGMIAPGESKTFTISTVGTWKFHNHADATKEGQVTVE